MPLTPVECRRLGQFARKHSIRFEAKPLVPGVIGSRMYQMTQERCPFLKDNRCLCYSIRPLVCRMYPLHPFAVKNCTSLEKTLIRALPVHVQMDFPVEMKACVLEYMRVIQPILRESTMVYSLDRGWRPRHTLPAIQQRVT